MHHFLQVDGLFTFIHFHLHFYRMHTADNCIIHIRTYVRKNIADDSMQCTYICMYILTAYTSKIHTYIHLALYDVCMYTSESYLYPGTRTYVRTYYRHCTWNHCYNYKIVCMYLHTLTAMMSKCAYIVRAYVHTYVHNTTPARAPTKSLLLLGLIEVFTPRQYRTQFFIFRLFIQRNV